MNREGTVLKLTTICDLSKVFMELKLCMERNGHGAIMQHDADSKPIRPDAAFQRLNNANQWNQEHEGDDRLMNEYNRSSRYLTTSCNVVCPAFLRLPDKDILEELEILNPRDVQIASQKNKLGMMALLQTNYGGWNSNKGDRNYL